MTMKHLNEGETLEVQGSGKNPYLIKNSGGVISCSCPAWRNQSLAIDQRTCKHIRAHVSNGFGGVTAPVERAVVPETPKNVPPCLLAHSWDGETDVTGWWCSYKLDGVRAWWDGERFWSRLGNEYHAPRWFKEQMPKGVVLDGELFGGNGLFQETVSIVRKMNPVDSEWKNIRFMVFDMPTNPGRFEDRYQSLLELIRQKDPGSGCWIENPESLVHVLDQDPVARQDGVLSWHLALAEKYGYAGIMLRKPGSLYEAGRSHTLLKVKSFKDCEVVVTGYEKGKGRHKGRVGSLVCRLDSGKTVSVGTGLSDHDRENPVPVGTRITIRYQELTEDGIPRFPSYLGARDYE